MNPASTADLELIITAVGEAHELRMRLTRPGDAGYRLGDPYPVAIEPELLREKESAGMDAYGSALRDMLFSPQAAAEFARLRAAARGSSEQIRVHLVLPDTLHALRWETLPDPVSGRTLAIDGGLLLSRHLSGSDDAPITLRPKGNLRALIAVAAPADWNDQGLPEIKAEAEIAPVRAALTNLQLTVITATWDALDKALREGYDIVYLVAHGVMRGDKPWLFLVDEDGSADRRSGKALSDLLRSLGAARRPRLVVLASCESAGDGYADALAALGPLLARADVPAVLAMQGKFGIATNAAFAPTFFRELLRDGVIDRAANSARLAIADRHDWWMPVLYTRLRDGVIWSDTQSTSSIDATLFMDQYRSNSQKHVQRIIEAHSRAIKPMGALPVIRQRNVTVHHEGQHRRFAPEGELIALEKSTFVAPFIDIARSSRNVLLLGDLGTGKTTLVCMLAEYLMKLSEQILVCVVPALALSHQNNLTVYQLLQLSSFYFNSQISPNTAKVDFEDLLNRKVELCLIVDGLDEAPILDAARILNTLRDIPEHWANVQVIATARPVELQGVSFNDWQVLTLVTMSDAELVMLFEEEAIAEGRTREQAQDEAHNLQKILKSLTALHSLANTPLVVRLLYSKLTKVDLGDDLTLGDLLFDIVQERLGKWDIRNQKAIAASNFESVFPDELSKFLLLGRMAFHFHRKKSFSIEEAKYWLYANLSGAPQLKIASIAKEAMDFYERSGLITITDNNIYFAIQPFFELLAGYGLASFWQESVGQGVSSTFPWRITSFAATVLRRLGVLLKFRDNLINEISHTLLHIKNFPGASYIIAESKDEMCAVAFVTVANSLEPRPIRLFSDEREQSARAIAYSLKLAQKAGFDWFFDQYLDPRYPMPDAAWSAEDVFLEWAALSLETVTPHEEKQLKALVMPHIKASTLQSLTVTPAIAILLPNLFDLPNLLWYSGKYLGQRRFSKQARTLFSEAFTRDKSVTNSVLIAIAEQGYENSASAAWLWVELNTEEQPLPIIVKTLIKEYGTRHINPDIEQWLQHCKLKMGIERWKAFIRWCLTSEGDPNLPGGAAILLFAEGERRLSLLGIPLLRILHDGGYVRKAEEVFGVLMQESGLPSLYFLSEQIAHLRGDELGAFSGYWRLLLSNLPHFEQEGPQILAQSASGVGCFLMARYPEVRQKFRNLLNSSNGAAYKAALRAKLRDFSAATRRGAAMILIVANPAAEAEALEVVIRERSRNSSGSWYEWERFCLSLSLGAAVLQLVEAKLTTFDSLGLVFALALLHRNRVKLQPQNFYQLVEGLLDVKNSSLDPLDAELSVLSSIQALPILVDIVKEGKHKNVIRAAEALLAHHQSKVTEEMLAKSLALTVDGGFWRIDRLSEELGKITSQPPYANSIMVVAKEITQQGGLRPLLDLIREALENHDVWEDVIWRMVCNSDRLSRNYEYGGQWLIDFGRSNEQYRKSIGQSAAKHFQDTRLRGALTKEPLQWLGVIAHEFVGLSEDDLLFALQDQGATLSSATQAIIARLGYIPSSFVQRRSADVLPEFHQIEFINRESNIYWDQLQGFAQQSDSLHPLVCNTLEAIIFNTVERPSALPSFEKEGLFGTLIDSALAFVFEHSINPEMALLIIPAFYERNQNDQCFARLRLIWALQYNVSVEKGAEEAEKYIAVFESALSNQTDDYAAIATELLHIRGYLTLIQATKALDVLTTDIFVDNFSLGMELNKWLADCNQDILLLLRDVLERNVLTLDAQGWSTRDGLLRNPTRYLVVSLAYWRAFGKGSEESYRVFWRGLKAAFTQGVGGDGDTGPTKVLSQFEPLLARVSRFIVEEAIASGQSSPDATVRSLARLFTFSSRLGGASSVIREAP